MDWLGTIIEAAGVTLGLTIIVYIGHRLSKYKEMDIRDIFKKKRQ